jgi:ATP-dependent Clp protease adaptor protein ClpS
MANTSVDIKEKVAINTKILPPPLFKVIYMNDNVTTMEFVIESLMAIFNHSREVSLELTTKIHEDGGAVVAVLPSELAEQKGIEATMMARQQGFPLLVRLEPTE